MGPPHNEFDRQVKDLLNHLSEQLTNISKIQKLVYEKQYKELLQTSVCDLCKEKADTVTIILADYTHKYYCNKCLHK